MVCLGIYIFLRTYKRKVYKLVILKRIVKLQKVLTIPIQQNEKLEEIYNVYLEAFKLSYAGYSYEKLRELFPSYNSNILVSASWHAIKFRKAVIKTHNYPKQLNPNPIFRKRDYKIDSNKIEIIYKPKNRLKLFIYPSQKQVKLMKETKLKSIELVKDKDGKFKLHLFIEKEIDIYKWKEAKTFIGVDIGLNYLAVCSAFDGNKFGNPLFFKGGEWKHLSRRQRKSNATKWKHLMNRKNEILHLVAKRIVEYAKKFEKPCIVMENLKKMKVKKTYNKWNNFLLSSWARKKLQEFINYKANWEGVPVKYVNPYNTSQICCYCGAKGKRKGIDFYCQRCGKHLNADFNASVNLARTAFRAKSYKRKAFSKSFNAFGEGDTCPPLSRPNLTSQPDESNESKMEIEVGLGIGREETNFSIGGGVGLKYKSGGNG